MRTLEADWTVERAGEVTLVGVELENLTPTPRRVRVANLLDGDVLPPRREGVPEEGWDADGYEGVVAAGARVAVGYACRGEAVCPPVDVTDEGRADGDADDPSPAELTARAIRELGTPRPPAAAVPVSGTEAGDGDVGANAGDDADANAGDDADTTVEATATAAETTATEPPETETNPTARPEAEASPTAHSESETSATTSSEAETDPTAHPGTATTPSHATVDEWLDGVERRVELGERFTGASVVEATEALSEAGGLDGTEALARRLAADPERLRAVARRAARLAARAEVVDVPVEALRRLS
ncbi:MAG: hypothetical protein ABEJ22_00500 [Haloferacaceae archaeon]